MIDVSPAIWNVLHDAIVVGISDAGDGRIRLELECDYLRERFDQPGDRFILTLSGCDRFVYRPRADEPTALADLRSIAERRLWLLRADAADGFLKVHCDEHIVNGSGGELEVSATAIDLALDTGRTVAYKEIERVAEESWEEWQAAVDKSRQ